MSAYDVRISPTGLDRSQDDGASVPPSDRYLSAVPAQHHERRSPDAAQAHLLLFKDLM